MPAPDGLTFFGYRRDGTFMGDFTRAVDTYRHEWRLGPYSATLRMSANDIVTDSDITHWFNTRFMAQCSVYFRGSECWRGYIGKMALHRDNLVLTKDVNNLTNAAKCSFRVKAQDEDENGAVWYTYYTHWYINEASLKLYGNFEAALEFTPLHEHNEDAETPPGIVDFYGYDANGDPIYLLRREDGTGRPITEPEGRADEYVKRHASPFTQSIMPAITDSNYLEMALYGAEVIANRILLSDGTFAYRLPSDLETWNYDEIDGSVIRQLRSVPVNSDYADTQFGETLTVSQEISRIIDVVRYNSQLYGHEPLLYPLGIAENPYYTTAGVDKPMGAVDRLRELAMLRDYDDNVYRLRIETDGGVLYEKYPKSPRYYSYPPPKGVRTLNDEVPTWDARPEPIKIIGVDWIDDLPETWLGDGSIIPVESVTMRDGADVAQFGTEEYTEDDLEAAFVANQRKVWSMRERWLTKATN